MSDDAQLGFATAVIHAGEGASASARPLTTPIYETTTFEFDSAADVIAFNEGKSSEYLYTRYGNPTITAVEAKLARLEQAEAAILFSSGQAATSAAIMSLASAGDEVLCSAAIYGGTLHLLHDFLSRFGIHTRFLSLDEMRHPAAAISDRTRVLWFETPINPTLRCVDIRTIADACRARGIVSAIDNTFASPINQQPLTLGADLVMHSATKYLNGHSDVTAGVLMGSKEMIQRMVKARRWLGGIIDPQPAYALGRGLKTVALRVAQHNANGLAVAEFLSTHAAVTQVYYPGLDSHPDHQIAARQMSGFGGMVCFDLGGSYERAARFFDRLRLIKRAASLGGVESLCSLPVITSQYGHTDDQLREAGVTRGMVRLSVGLEDVQDLIADLEQALAG
jgi:cystathionine beta-lyase/cystathionine gamma-synthase